MFFSKKKRKTNGLIVGPERSFLSFFLRTVQYCNQAVCNNFRFSHFILSQPFEAITSFKFLTTTTSPPEKSAFFSTLKGDHIKNISSISNEEYARFLAIWHGLGIKEYFTLFKIYAALDASLGFDICSFYFNFLYKVCGLYPTHFLTSASFGLHSALFNSKDPHSKNKPLRIEILPEYLSNTYSAGLVGGFSFVSANWTEFNSLELPKAEEKNAVPDSHVRLCTYQDINCLYSSILGTYHCFSDFHVLSETENQAQFKTVANELWRGNLDFFHSQ